MIYRHSVPFRFVSLLLLVLLVVPTNSLIAQDHVVNQVDLEKAIKKASQTRQDNADKVKNFFSTLPAQKLLVDTAVKRKIDKAVCLLDDDELALLAEQVDQIEGDVAGGLSTGAIIAIVAAGVAGSILLVYLLYDEEVYYY